MSVVDHVLKEELDRLIKLSLKYKDELQKLPKGSLSKKQRNRQIYVYRAYRVKDKVKFEYLGKESSPAVQEAKRQMNLRLSYQDKLRQVNSDIKDIRRAVLGCRRLAVR